VFVFKYGQDILLLSTAPGRLWDPPNFVSRP